jgi:hypothetical protein
MFLFLKLILAHLIADFILQFEELYQLKVRSFLGQLLHVLVHGVVSLALLYPYLNEPVIWAFVAGAVLIHLAQDLLKYSFTKKTPKNTFAYFMLDQACHVLVLTAIFLFPISREVRGFPDSALFNMLYTQDVWTLRAIFFILLTFGGSYILNAFAKSYLKDSPPLFMITSTEMFHSIFERTLVAWIILHASQLPMLLLIPFVGLLRLFSAPLRNLKALLLSLNYTVLLSILFHKIL